MLKINYRLVAVRSNLTSVTQQRGQFLRKNLGTFFQNTAGGKIEAERPTATQNFW